MILDRLRLPIERLTPSIFEPLPALDTHRSLDHPVFMLKKADAVWENLLRDLLKKSIICSRPEVSISMYYENYCLRKTGKTVGGPNSYSIVFNTRYNLSHTALFIFPQWPKLRFT
jgi:hypothetical protein